MSHFSKNWDAPPKKTPPPSGPLKPHIENSIYLIQQQNQRLDQASARLAIKDKQYFDRVVDNLTRHDRSKALIAANELVQVRKLEKNVLQIKLALEQISLRLTTVKDYGDFLNTMAPALSILKGVKPGVQEVVPLAEKGFNDLSQSLSGIVTEAGYNTILNAPIETANVEASDILSEAASVAEQKLKEKFPDLPAEVSKERVKI
jgi:division protein CdvB (Snf7/Vps24/ESCRT-III family)